MSVSKAWQRSTHPFVLERRSEVSTLDSIGAETPSIARAELRLGLPLRGSFRKFLEVSNGCRPFVPIQIELWPVDKIDLCARLSPEWYRILGAGVPALHGLDLAQAIQISPEDEAMVVLIFPSSLNDGEEDVVVRLGSHTTDLFPSYWQFWKSMRELSARFY